MQDIAHSLAIVTSSPTVFNALTAHCRYATQHIEALNTAATQDDNLSFYALVALPSSPEAWQEMQPTLLSLPPNLPRLVISPAATHLSDTEGLEVLSAPFTLQQWQQATDNLMQRSLIITWPDIGHFNPQSRLY